MNGQVDHGALEEFLRGKGLLGQSPGVSSVIRSMSLPVEKKTRFDQPPPVTQLGLEKPSYGEMFGRFLQNKGYELKAPVEEFTKPLPVTDPRAPTREQVAAGLPLLTPGPEIPTPEQRPQEILDRPADFVPPPGWWQQVKDVSFLLRTGDLNALSIASRGLLSGLTFGNIDPIKMVEKISGVEGFAAEYDAVEKGKFQNVVGYTPSTAVEVPRRVGEFVGSLVPFSRILKGAGAVAKGVSKIPALRALARAEFTGAAVGLAARPEEEGILNRIKQIPPSIAFFTVMDMGILSAQQVLKMVRYNRAAKFYKNVDWNAIPDPPGGETYTAKQMRDLFIKFRRNVDPATRLPKGITAEEERILEFFKETGAWKEAAKEGWIPPKGFDPARPIPETGIPARQPRKPRFADIFRRPPFAPFEPGFEPPETRPRPSRAGAPTEPPPPPPEPAATRAQAPPGPRTEPGPTPTPRRGAPAVVVDVKPNAEGGWTYDFKIPTPKTVPTAPLTIEWRPELKRLPEAKVVPATDVKKPDLTGVWRPRAHPVFKNPLYEAINLQGGIKPNAFYKYNDLKEVLPFNLISKSGYPMDRMAGFLTEEFPGIEGNDKILLEMLDGMAVAGREAKATFKRNPNAIDPDDPLEHTPPPEYFKEEIDNAILDQIAVGREAELAPEDLERARELLSAIDPETDLSLEDAIPRIKEIMKARRAIIEKEALEAEAQLPEFVTEDLKGAKAGLEAEEVVGITDAEAKDAKKRAVKKLVDEERAKTKIKAAEAPRLPEEKPKPAAPKKAPPVVPEDTLVKTLDDLNVPADLRGEVSVSVLENFDPKKGVLTNYIRRALSNIKKKTTPKPKPKPAEPIEVPSKERGPSGRFAGAQAEVDILEAIERSTKSKKDVEIVRRRILDEDSFEDIGRKMKISRQRAQKVFADTIVKMKKDPEVIKLLENRYKEVHSGPKPNWEEMSRTANKYFTSSKGVSDQIDAANDRRISGPIADLFLTTLEGKEIEKWIRNNNNAALRQQVKELLTGERTINDQVFPEDVPAEAIASLRKRIDDLSTMIMLHGGLKEPTLAAFESGIGKYLGTFYRLHEYNELNKGKFIKQYWGPPQDVRDRFAAALKKDDPGAFADFTDEMMDNFLDSMLRGEDYIYKGSNRTKRVPTDHYTQKKDLSPEFKEFAGIITDPIWLSLKTVTKQATMAYNAEFLNTLEDSPETSKLITHDLKTARSRGWQSHQLPDDYSYGRLRGAWVHPELDEFIRGEIMPQESVTERIIMKFIMNPFKWTKTIGSIPTHARNFTGNPMFSFLMKDSISNPFNIPYYWQALRIGIGRKGKFRNEWTQLIRDGVTDTQFWKSEIPAFYNELLKLDPADWPEKIANYLFKKPAAFAGELYNFEDQFYRISAHLKNIQHFKMTPEESVKELNLSSPNYRKVPKVVEWLRKYPVFGPFISFRFNVARILTNNALQAGKDIASKDPKRKIKGALRMYRLAFVIGLPLVLAKVAKKVFDVDEKKIKELERTYPKYRRGGTVIYYRDKDGKLKGYDFTYTYPTGDILQAIGNLTKGDIESFTESAQLFAHPIFDAFSIIVKGKDPYWGTPIDQPVLRRATELAKLLWLPQSAPIPSIQGLIEGIKTGDIGENLRVGSLTTYQIENLIQAYQKQEDRYGRVRELPEELRGFFTGVRTWDVDPDVLIDQYLKQKKFELDDALAAWERWEKRNSKAAYWQQDEQEARYNATKDRIEADILRVGLLLESMDPTFHLRKSGRFK